MVKEAWVKVSGNKGAPLIGLAIYIVVQVAISFVLGLFIGGDAPAPDAAANMSTPGKNLADTLANLLTLPLVLPGIYLAVSYQLSLPLVADKGLGPWEAMETSRKIVSK